MTEASETEAENSDIFEEGADVEEVMSRIAKKFKISRDVKKTARSEDSSKFILDRGLSQSHNDIELLKGLEYLNSNCSIQNNQYIIDSHRMIIGRPLVKGRELVHGEVRRYIDPIITKQSEFNSKVSRILSLITKKTIYESLNHTRNMKAV